MKIMITGGKGMLGRTLQKEFSDQSVLVADLPECDITDAAAFDALVAAQRPDVVIHCAAMTQVDECEAHPEKAFLLNHTGSDNVAAACARHRVRLIAISTDYVFKGDLNRPYCEDDPAGPQTVYGKSKLAGEEAVRQRCPDAVICRISWLYGSGGPSFVHTMIKLADGSRPELKVVADQIGNPTSTLAVARKLREILARPELSGVFHVTCMGEASWYEFALEIFRQMNIRQTVTACTSAEFPRPAPRPLNSRLEKRALALHGLSPMPDWHDALREFLASEF